MTSTISSSSTIISLQLYNQIKDELTVQGKDVKQLVEKYTQ